MTKILSLKVYSWLWNREIAKSSNPEVHFAIVLEHSNMIFIKLNKHDSQTLRTRSKPEDRSGGQQVSSRIWHTDRGNSPNGGQGSRQKAGSWKLQLWWHNRQSGRAAGWKWAVIYSERIIGERGAGDWDWQRHSEGWLQVRQVGNGQMMCREELGAVRRCDSLLRDVIVKVRN